nr:phage antirepressor KilAC domain-containing protein [Clostridioides sp.]
MNNLVAFKNENIEVDGRELHEFLAIETDYTKWFSRMCEYGFIENEDYKIITEQVHSQKRQRTYEQVNHKMSLDMAKEICMIQRSEKGKKARRYFLQVEKDWNSPEKIMARSLLIAHKTIENQGKLLEEQVPKVLFADAVSTSKATILVGEMAKILKQNGIDTGEKRLFTWLRDNGYLIKRKGSDYNMPTQRSMELKLFEVKESTHTHSDGHISVNKTTKVTGKGQQYFIKKFVGKEQISMIN